MAEAELLKGKTIGGLREWARVGTVAGTGGIRSCVPLKDTDFVYERWRVFAGVEHRNGMTYLRF